MLCLFMRVCVCVCVCVILLFTGTKGLREVPEANGLDDGSKSEGNDNNHNSKNGETGNDGNNVCRMLII